MTIDDALHDPQAETEAAGLGFLVLGLPVYWYWKGRAR